jgi:ACS family D-galactonate transporter-like MFS transporter
VGSHKSEKSDDGVEETSYAGGVSASLSGWSLHLGGSYTQPMLVIFVFLTLGATSTVVLR